VKQAIAKHARDFALVVGLVVVALGVGGYVLSNQRFHLPSWVPVVGSDFVSYEAEFTTAQSVTPGQGQTVQIAGVDVGEITSVELEDGRAVVGMRVRRRFTPIFKDATALLRPKTGLNDMVVQLAPGSRAAGEAPEGYRIPVEQTALNVNFDEILSSLDADTRDYLQLLVNGGGQAVGANGRRLSAALKRFEPTARGLARLNGALAERRRNIRRAIHNFRLLGEALGAKDDDLATLVDSSNRVFRVFATESESLRRSLRLLPGALGATSTALARARRLGDVLGPTLEDLRPAARALGPALRDVRPFLRDTLPPIRDQLRPFARDTLPVVRELRPAARDLADVTPRLDESFRVLNYTLNTLAYNPPGREEGFLFWASWANHNGMAIFGTQDAHGPIRRGAVVTSCASLAVLDVIGQANPVLGTLAALLNPPQRAAICPTGFPPAAATPAAAAAGAPPAAAGAAAAGPAGGTP
jgi:phospholipid/cholesterol/gamma-HCH transport system substrate-binding protein